MEFVVVGVIQDHLTNFVPSASIWTDDCQRYTSLKAKITNNQFNIFNNSSKNDVYKNILDFV